MNVYIDRDKQAIEDHSVFDGLAVDAPGKFAALFMAPWFYLLVIDDGSAKAYVIFEEWQGGFVFHLVNFTKMKTRTMTEDFIKDRVIPYCRVRGLNFIQARAERKGMARKLSALGFEPIGARVYRREVSHVL